MTTETGKAKVETAYGKAQPKDKQEYIYEYRVFANPDEALNAGFNFVELANEREKTNKKAAAYQAAIAWAKPDKDDPEVLTRNMVKSFLVMNPGVPEDKAKEIIANLLKAGAAASAQPTVKK